jgi:hypothetical protein
MPTATPSPSSENAIDVSALVGTVLALYPFDALVSDGIGQNERTYVASISPLSSVIMQEEMALLGVTLTVYLQYRSTSIKDFEV